MNVSTRVAVWISCLIVALLACVSFPRVGSAATQEQIDGARNAALAWLLRHQRGDGAWRGPVGTEVAATASALDGLTRAGLVTGYPYAAGVSWLRNAPATSVDSLTRSIWALRSAGSDVTPSIQTLLQWRNGAMAWGAYAGFGTSFPDTPLALGALRVTQTTYASQDLATGLCAIVIAQKTGDATTLGSWSFIAPGTTTPATAAGAAILPTTANTLEINAIATATGWPWVSCNGNSYVLTTAVNNGINWLLSQRRNADGGFGDQGTSTILETALVYEALSTLSPANSATGAALDFLIAHQSPDGSWNGDALDTAYVLKVFPAPVTALVDSDNDGIPDAVETLLATNPTTADSRWLARGNGLNVVTVLTPDHVVAGGSAFTLAIDGEGFAASSIVRWNAVDRPTTYVNATTLRAVIPAADIATAGTAQVNVFTPPPGAGNSGSRTFTVQNPVPALTGLSPSTAIAGSGGFTMLLTGSNFVSSSIVRWNGANRTTNFVSAAQLQATIPTADLAAAGTFPITVFTPEPGGGSSSVLSFVVSPQSYPLTIAKNVNVSAAGLAAYWRFDDAIGSVAADDSGSGNAGTVQSATWTTGRFGGALSFNGTNSIVAIPDNVVRSSTVMTVIAWFKTTTSGVILAVQNQAYPTQPTNSVAILYVGTDGHLRGQLSQGAIAPITTNGPVNDGQWHQAAIVTDGAVQVLYLDGVTVGSLSGPIAPLSLTKNQIGVGYTNGWPAAIGGWFAFSGQIDDARIYDRALTATEISTLATGGGGSGTVTSSPGGINCGSTCAAPFPNGSAVNMTATPSTGFAFTGWSGAGCSGTGTCAVTMTNDMSVTANFSVIGSPALTLTYNGKLRDRVQAGTLDLGPDGQLDGTLTATLNATGGRTVTRLYLHSSASGSWDTDGASDPWVVGAATTLDGPLLNDPTTMAVNFAVADGGAFHLFAADFAGTEFVQGVTLTLTATFSDGTSATATTVVAGDSYPTLTLTYNGKLRDRVGLDNAALAADGALDGVLTVTVAAGSGRTVTGLKLQSTALGNWDTDTSTAAWALGAATSVDGVLLNDPATMAVSFAVADGGSFVLFASDQSATQFVLGAILTLTATFSDGTTATATTTVGGGPAALTVFYNGKLRDRVQPANAGLGADGQLDGTLTVFLAAGGGRTVTRLYLGSSTPGSWDTDLGTTAWVVGVATTLDGPLLNDPTTMAVNFPVADGGSFQLFGADFANSEFVSRVTLTVTATFSDGTTATGTRVLP